MTDRYDRPIKCQDCKRTLTVKNDLCDDCVTLWKNIDAEQKRGDRKAERWLRNHVLESLDRSKPLKVQAAAWLMRWIMKQPWGTRPTSKIKTKDLTESDVERIYESELPFLESPEGKALRRLITDAMDDAAPKKTEH